MKSFQWFDRDLLLAMEILGNQLEFRCRVANAKTWDVHIDFDFS